jgi:hypothetical protein
LGSDVRNDLSDRGFLQFICIWISVEEFQLGPGVADQHIWTPSPSGSFSSKSAYDSFFLGAVSFEPADRIWISWAPPKCKFFLWLAALNQCWIADRLARRGLEHVGKHRGHQGRFGFRSCPKSACSIYRQAKMRGISKIGGGWQREGCLQPGGRASTLWWLLGLGGFRNIGIVVCLRVPPLVLLGWCKTSRTRPGCGAWPGHLG